MLTKVLLDLSGRSTGCYFCLHAVHRRRSVLLQTWRSLRTHLSLGINKGLGSNSWLRKVFHSQLHVCYHQCLHVKLVAILTCTLQSPCSVFDCRIPPCCDAPTCNFSRCTRADSLCMFSTVGCILWPATRNMPPSYQDSDYNTSVAISCVHLATPSGSDECSHECTSRFAGDSRGHTPCVWQCHCVQFTRLLGNVRVIHVPHLVFFFFFSWKLNTEVDLLSGSMSLAILHSTDYSPLQRVPGIYFFFPFFSLSLWPFHTFFSVVFMNACPHRWHLIYQR